MLAQHFVFATKGEIMATSAPVAEGRTMSIGRVLERAWIAVRTNPGVIFGLALLVGAIPGLIMTWLFIQIGLGSPDALATGAVSMRTMMGATLVTALVSVVIAALVQGALTRATVVASEGGKVSFGDSLSTGLKVALPLIGLAIVSGVGIMLGFILLVVPGIILLLMWSVAVPALVVERIGIFEALARSNALTKGAKWRIFGLAIIIFIAYWLLSIVLGLFGLAGYAATSATGFGLGNLIGGIVLGTLFNTAWGTIQPSLYVELRQWKEGTDVESLKQVFA
jgi:uncharacterized membrane protein